MLQRNLCGATELPVFKDAINNARKEEYEDDYLDKQLNLIDFYNLNKEDQILNLKNLIKQKDVRTALKLAQNTDFVTRYQKRKYHGLILEDMKFISCTHLKGQGVFFGLIQTIFSFNFPQLKLPYIEIQILFDVMTLKAQQLTFDEKVLYIGSKKIHFRGQKELVLTNQYTIIQQKQMLSIINLETPQQYALMKNDLKNGPNFFFNRFSYNFDNKTLELLNKKVEICDKCQLLLDPQQQKRIKFCTQCQDKFVHENCITDQSGILKVGHYVLIAIIQVEILIKFKKNQIRKRTKIQIYPKKRNEVTKGQMKQFYKENKNKIYQNFLQCSP